MTKMLEVEIEKIVENPYQPRKRFNDEALQELSQSIRSVGLLHPPVVRPHGEYFELVSGERRLRAAKLAGLLKIPVVIHEGTRSFSAQATLIENIQRVDLNPLEIAYGLKKLIDEFSFQHEELADKVGKKRATVTNYLRLLALPKAVQDGLRDEKITMGHAKALLAVEGFERVLSLYTRIVEEELSVRETERLAQKIAQEPKKEMPPLKKSQDPFYYSLEEALRERLGTKVAITGEGKKGTIQIDYYDLDDLDRVLQILGVSL